MRIALIRNGRVERVISADIAFARTLGYDHAIEHPEAAEGWQYVDGVLVAPPVEPAPEPPAQPREITLLAFYTRVGIDALTGVERASIDDPTAPQESRLQAASLRALMRMLDAVKDKMVNLDDPRTQLGVMTMAQAGLLTQAHAESVLNAEIQSYEQ
ncbi:hypothetical protein [Stenotrophomonas acidaminiphila]|uniref:hypothetical protein n=1 Tax=Stenotrophomonas acidaminiphila TaxID=128780 RepID=UPI0028ABA045|nr:hypothetical protein [Stenotrophomonas acidaminiphila]